MSAAVIHSPYCSYCRDGQPHERADHLRSIQSTLQLAKLMGWDGQPEDRPCAAVLRVELHRRQVEFDNLTKTIELFEAQRERVLHIMLGRQEELNSEIAVIKLQIEGVI